MSGSADKPHQKADSERSHSEQWDDFPDSAAGLTYTDTAAFADHDLRDPPTTATDLWSALIDEAGLIEPIISTTRDLIAGNTLAEARETIANVLDVEPSNLIPTILASLGRRTDSKAYTDAIDRIERLVSGRPLGFDPGNNATANVLSILNAAEEPAPPTVAITLPEGFREVQRETRSAWCQLVAMVGRVCDVRLISSRVDRAWLSENHRDDLPGVSEWRDPRPDEDALAAVVEAVDIGSREERILTHLAEDDTETATYARLYNEFSVSSSRMRQVIGELADVDAVESYGPISDRRLELTSIGRQFVDEEIARQQRLSVGVSDSRNLSNKGSVTSACTWEGENRPETATADRTTRHRLPSGHETRFMNRLTAAGALGSSVEDGISVVNYPVDLQADRAEGRFHADDGRVVVSAEGDNPMQWWITMALTLASPRMFDRVLTKDRLNEHDVTDMLDDAPTVLRAMRNVGWLPDSVETYDDLREAMLEAATELADRTTELYKRREADEDTHPLRTSILRQALGLATSMTHLLDLADVELVRVLKIPEFSRRFDAERAEPLWKTIAYGSTLGARYGNHVAYRQLFENRTDKRRQAFEPTIDAADPVARDAGSWVIVGDFCGRTDEVADGIAAAFSEFSAHDDAPEMQVRSSIQTEPTRRQVAETARRALDMKGLKLTPEATSLFHAVARTPFDVVNAIAEGLEGGNDGRRIDASEVRRSLAELSSNRLLRGFDGRQTTPRRLLSALLEADAPLRRSELDERAGVSARSRRDHLRDFLEVGLAIETDHGVRLDLSFGGLEEDNEHAERLTDRYPTNVVDPEMSPERHAAAKILRVGREHHGPGGPVTSPGWPYTGVTPTPDLRELYHPRPHLETLLPALWAIRAIEEYADDPGVAPLPDQRDATAGPRLNQTSLK